MKGLKYFLLMLIAITYSCKSNNCCNISTLKKSILVVSDKLKSEGIVIKNLNHQSRQYSLSLIYDLITSKELNNSSIDIICFFNCEKVQSKDLITKIILGIIEQIENNSSTNLGQYDDKSLYRVMDFQKRKLLCLEDRNSLLKKIYNNVKLNNNVLIKMPGTEYNDKINAVLKLCPHQEWFFNNETDLSLSGKVLNKKISSDSSEAFLMLVIENLNHENVSLIGSPIKENDTIWFDLNYESKIEIK